MPAADLYVLPSNSESFGLSALEAQACGIPVLGYAVGGLPEVVESGVTGPSCRRSATSRASPRPAAALLGDPARYAAMSCVGPCAGDAPFRRRDDRRRATSASTSASSRAERRAARGDGTQRRAAPGAESPAIASFRYSP